MIHTGLPYDFEQMEEIRENGAIVDMSDIDFPGIKQEEQSKTVFIFLRNTGFSNIKLDFSKCSYEERADILDEYLTTGFDVYIEELVEATREVILSVLKESKEEKFFTKEEAYRFYESHQDVCNEVLDILNSSFLFVIKTTEAFKDASVEEEVTTKYVGANIANLFKMKDIEAILLKLFDQHHQPKYYTDIFTLDNHPLYEAVHESTVFPAILFGLGTEEPEAWNAAFEEAGV